jgi:two-component system sensor histidine kinase/response regulator
MKGDPIRVRQILTNLVCNAIKFTAHGQVMIDVEVANRESQRCHVLLSVTDTGIGLDGEKISTIFDKFTQADTSTTRQYGGTGLGLTICKLLTELMGGSIGVSSELGRGSTFWVSLEFPLAEAVMQKKEERKLSDVRVLYVDQSMLIRQIFEEQLLHEGMRVDGCGSGNDALKALQTAVNLGDPYRIAVVDNQILDIDPMTLGTAIKSDSTYSDTLLVLVNSPAQAIEMRGLAEAGFSAVLRKPLSRQVLINTMNTLCTAIENGEPPPFLTGAHIAASLEHNTDKLSQFDGFRILVVDDNIVNQSVVVHMLRKFGCKTELANDGLQAVAKHRAQQFDLILMDCQMPELDGYQATARIRAHEETLETDFRVPIVALTAHALAGEREKCLASGMDDFVPKPIRPSSLRDILNHWLPAAQQPIAVSEEIAPADDLDAMKDMFGEDFPELAHLFQSDSRKRISALHQAATRDDRTEMIRLTHALSGSASSMGASSLAYLCKTVEAQLKSGALEDLEAAVRTMEADYIKIDARLQQLLKLPIS